MTMFLRKRPCVATKPTSYSTQAWQTRHICVEGHHVPDFSMYATGEKGQDMTRKKRPPASIKIHPLESFCSIHKSLHLQRSVTELGLVLRIHLSK